jgi:hypothetical protein
MRYQSLVLVLSFTIALGLVHAAPVAAQTSKAVQTVAGMLTTINHFPNDAQKKTLETLAADSATTAQEKVLIQAILGMQHSVSAADKPKLEALVKDQSASAGVRTLAEILARFLHMASAADKAALSKLAA